MKRMILSLLLLSLLSATTSGFFASTNPYTHVYYYAWYPDQFTNHPAGKVDCYKPFPLPGSGQCPTPCSKSSGCGCDATHDHLGFSAKDLGSVFWPAIANPLGNPPMYDSTATATINTHGDQILSSGAKSAIISYGGPASAALPSLATVSKIANIFGPKGIRLSFAFRNYSGRDAICSDDGKCVQEDMKRLALGSSPAVSPSYQYKVQYDTLQDQTGVPRPVFYIFAAPGLPGGCGPNPNTGVPGGWWCAFLNLPNSFREQYRFIVLGGSASLSYARDEGFDGFYNYSPATRQSSDYYKMLADQAWNNKLIYSAGVSPGYNTMRTKHDACLPRNPPAYRTQLTNAALAKPHFISIVSFNEWGEGTQIEPATTNSNGKSGVFVAGKSTGCTATDPEDCGYQYLGYVGDSTNPSSPTIYLNITNTKVGANKWSPRKLFTVQ
jgi:hypothetical protein